MTDHANTTLPFGRFKGKLLSEVPPDYLEWALRNSDIVHRDAELRLAILKTLGKEAADDGEASDELTILQALVMPGGVLDRMCHQEEGGTIAALAEALQSLRGEAGSQVLRRVNRDDGIPF